jgi:signal transduction histidine kinase
MVHTFTTQCSLALYQTQPLSQVEYQQWQHTLLVQSLQILNYPSSPAEILADLLKLIGQSFQVEQVILWNQEQEQSQIVQKWQLRADFSPENQHQSLNVISVDVVIREQLFGRLTLNSTYEQRNFSAEERQTLEAIAPLLAIALNLLKTEERLQQLEQENQKLKAASQTKSEFLSHINHEFRTPLTAILGFSRMLGEEIYGSLNPKQKQYINGISISGKHLLELVNDFLDLSKIEANREELYLERIAVEDICLSTFSMMQTPAKEQGLELNLDIAPDVDFCHADRRRLKQILLNLLSNGIKFTEVGCVTLQVKRTENQLQFAVIDTGIGIKEADREKLFQPFQQINSLLSRQHKGTGLGLALSRKLAQLHGGDLTVTSTEGQGSCFTLHLPLSESYKNQENL